MNSNRGENFYVAGEHVKIFSDGIAKVAQNPCDLVTLLGLKLLDAVVEIDDAHRLNKNSCAGRALVVDDAGELRFIFQLDGQNVTVAAHGNQCVLKKFLS